MVDVLNCNLGVAQTVAPTLSFIVVTAIICVIIQIIRYVLSGRPVILSDVICDESKSRTDDSVFLKHIQWVSYLRTGRGFKSETLNLRSFVIFLVGVLGCGTADSILLTTLSLECLLFWPFLLTQLWVWSCFLFHLFRLQMEYNMDVAERKEAKFAFRKTQIMTSFVHQGVEYSHLGMVVNVKGSEPSEMALSMLPADGFPSDKVVYRDPVLALVQVSLPRVSMVRKGFLYCNPILEKYTYDKLPINRLLKTEFKEDYLIVDWEYLNEFLSTPSVSGPGLHPDESTKRTNQLARRLNLIAEHRELWEYTGRNVVSDTQMLYQAKQTLLQTSYLQDLNQV
jgi:hypothetical protein